MWPTLIGVKLDIHLEQSSPSTVVYLNVSAVPIFGPIKQILQLAYHRLSVVALYLNNYDFV